MLSRSFCKIYWPLCSRCAETVSMLETGWAIEALQCHSSPIVLGLFSGVTNLPSNTTSSINRVFFDNFSIGENWEESFPQYITS